MREAIGGSWLFQIVVAIILIFVGYLCLAINHSKAFNVKNSIITAIELQDGMDLTNPTDDASVQDIVAAINGVAYRTTGSCPGGYTGINRNGDLDSRSSAFCIKKIKARNVNSDELPDKYFYKVVVFYKLDLPIFNNFFNFQITGDTRVM